MENKDALLLSLRGLLYSPNQTFVVLVVQGLEVRWMMDGSHLSLMDEWHNKQTSHLSNWLTPIIPNQ